MPPRYMMPGTPRFRLPDFSVRTSPMAPNMMTVPNWTADWISCTIWSMLMLIWTPPFRPAG